MEFQCSLLSPPFLVKMDEGANISEEELLSFVPFVNWVTTLKASLELQFNENHPFHGEPFALRSVRIQSVDRFGPRMIGFVKLYADVESKGHSKLPGVTLLRGAYVAILMILRPSDSKNERWVVVTTQPRIPVGRLQYCEIPAGMIDQHSDFAGAAAKEIKEQTGLSVNTSELIDMTALASDGSEEGEYEVKHGEELKSVMYPSASGSDESISIFLWEKVLDRLDIEDLRQKLSPRRKNSGEKITVNIIKYEELWKVGFRDAKTIAAWALYEGLKKAKHPGLRGGKAGELRLLSQRLERRSNVTR